MDGRKMGSMEENDVEIIDVEGDQNEVSMAGSAQEHMQDDRAMRTRQNEQAGGGQVRGHYGQPPPSARQMSLSPDLETKSSEIVEETRRVLDEAAELEMFLADLATAHVLQVCPSTMLFEDKFRSLLAKDNGMKKE